MFRKRENYTVHIDDALTDTVTERYNLRLCRGKSSIEMIRKLKAKQKISAISSSYQRNQKAETLLNAGDLESKSGKGWRLLDILCAPVWCRNIDRLAQRVLIYQIRLSLNLPV